MRDLYGRECLRLSGFVEITFSPVETFEADCAGAVLIGIALGGDCVVVGSLVDGSIQRTFSNSGL